MIRFFGYKNCDTCRKAEAFLKSQGQAYTFIDITLHPPSGTELKAMIDQAGLKAQNFLNTAGEVYRTLGLKDKVKTMSQDDLIALLAANGRLIKRPLISDGSRANVGFKEEQKALWS